MLNVLFLKQIANDKNLKFTRNKNSIYDKEWKMTFKSEQKRKEFIDFRNIYYRAFIDKIKRNTDN